MTDTWTNMEGDKNLTTALPGINNSLNLSAEDFEKYELYQGLSHELRLYVTPIILFGGTLGNMMTIVVVLSHHFRHHPSSIPLITLAFVDIGVLYFNLLDIWLWALTGDGPPRQYTRGLNSAGCKFSSFATMFLTQCSSWILVLINIDRVVSVYKPLKARTWCTRRRLALAVLSIMLLLALVNLHIFWTVKFDPTRDFHHPCQYHTALLGDHGELAWLTIDASLFVFVPFVLIFGCNVYIILSLLKAKRKRRQSLEFQLSAASNQPVDNTRSITMMLITISIVFLITTSPLTVCYQFNDALTTNFKYDPLGRALWYDLIINTVLVLVCYSNNALNFLLYCISGSKFREALSDVCAGRIGRRYRRQCTMDAYTMRSSTDYLGPSSLLNGTPLTARRMSEFSYNRVNIPMHSARSTSNPEIHKLRF